MTPTLVIDIFLIALLIATIVIAITLHRRLSMVRSDHLHLKELAATFVEATRRAEDSIATLKSSTEILRERISTAEGVHDDLCLLIERANAAADRLEAAVACSRHQQSPSVAFTDTLRVDEPLAVAPKRARSEAERALLDALGIRDF